MVLELQKSQFVEVQMLFEPLKHHLAISAVLTGASPGRVWVDDLLAPQTAVVWDQVGMRIYFAGASGNSSFNTQFNDILLNDIYPQAKHIPQRYELTYYMRPKQWERQVRLVLAGTGVLVNQSEYFRLDPQAAELPAAVTQIPQSDLRIVPLDEALLDAQEETHPLREWVEHIYDTAEAFLWHGIAYGGVATVTNTLVGWCVAAFCVADDGEVEDGRRCELLLHTLETYRQKGVATEMLRAAVAACRAKGVTEIGMHVRLADTAAVRTVVKGGFTPVFSEPIYHCWINPIDNYFKLARRCQLTADWDGQAEALRKAFILVDARVKDLPEAQMWQTEEQKRQAYENAAVAYVRVSDYWGALDMLERAVYDLGWGEEDWARWQAQDVFDQNIRHTGSWMQFVRDVEDMLQNQTLFDDSDLPDLIS